MFVFLVTLDQGMSDIAGYFAIKIALKSPSALLSRLLCYLMLFNVL